MVVLVGMGEHMGERFLPLYLADLTSGATTLVAIGLLAGLDDLLSALYSYPGGWLTDRWGARRALLAFNVLAAIGYAIIIFVPRWWAVLLGAALFISWSAISMPAIMDLVPRLVPGNRQVLGISLHALVRRIPKILGPLAGGACIAAFGLADGIRVAFLGALVLTAIGAFLQWRFLPCDRTPGPRGDSPTPAALWAGMGRDLRVLLSADILVRFCERIPDAFVILWATRLAAHPISELEFGALSALESIVAMVLYIPAAIWADRGGRKAVVTATLGFFALFPLVLHFAQTPLLLALAFIVRGMKEFGEPTRKALIVDLAPPDRRAATFGFYYLLRDTVVSVAALAGAALWGIAPSLNLAVAFSCGVAATVVFAARFQLPAR